MTSENPVVNLNNYQAEESVLGSILIDPDALFEVSHFLQTEHFYREINGWIFSAMQYLAQHKIPIDLVTLPDELRRREQLKEIGGESYIIGLLTIVPTSNNVEAYARIVEDMATRRRILAASSMAASLALDQELPIDEVISEAEAALFAVSHRRASQ